MTYLSDYIFPKIIKGIDSVLTEEGYSIILKNTNNSRSKEAECLEDLLMKNVDGIIIEPSKSHIFCKHTNLYKKLDEYNIPYIFIQGSYSQMADKPSSAALGLPRRSPGASPPHAFRASGLSPAPSPTPHDPIPDPRRPASPRPGRAPGALPTFTTGSR